MLIFTMFRRALIAASVLAMFVGGVAKGAEEPLDPDHAAKMARGTDIFKRHVRAVLIEQCLACHGGDKTEGRLDLTTRELLLKGGAKGAGIKPGQPQASLLYKVVSHQGEPAMPYGEDKLPEETLAHFAQWIECGAPYDAPLLGEDELSAWTRQQVPDEARQFWAFQPLAAPAVPEVADAGWCRSPIDRFVRHKQEQAGISPNPSADKRTLLRRASFDLIGLPPTPQELAEFLQDTSDDAYEKALDRLLDSPRYGERWARHWLDLARFAESHGFEHDYDRPTAYHYRDFVIEALNADLPYDTFVKWQIAGDEYAPRDNLALKATGFLAAGVHSTQITANEVERHRYDELDDILNTVGTSMLGLTFGCARCHDHKFDPIPAADYYRMLSAFTTTVRTEVDLDVDPAGYQAALAAFQAEHAPFAAALQKFERDELPGRFAAWEAAGNTAGDKYPWTVLEFESAKSQGGATLTLQDDGSLLASGTSPANDIYTFVAKVPPGGIRAIRLEALSDPSFVKGGPGRADNGNFALTEFSLTAAPADAADQAMPVKLQNARATFEQAGLPVASAIDGKGSPGWAVDPEFGKSHAAAFDVAGEAGYPSGTILTFTLRFNNNTKHSIGRPRLSITTQADAVDLLAPGMPQKIADFLGKPAGQRTNAETAQLAAWYRTLDPQWQALNKQVEEHLLTAPKPNLVKALISSEGLPPLRLHSQGADFFNDTFFLRRGDPNQKQGIAAPGFLQVLMPAADAQASWQQPPPDGWRTSYRRRAMAEWLTDVDNGAGALLARVMANRLWQHHLGRGIVATPSDFGTRGERPTHPELLDWLAGELIRQDWKLKPLHKQIMSSAAYRQSAQHDEARLAADGDNKLIWRQTRRRLEAEVVRDALLAVGGQLDTTMYGPGTLDGGSRRRSIYFTVKRSQIMPMLQVFDAPDALSGVGERPTTTIAPQALYLLNNPQARAAAKGLAERVATVDGNPSTLEQAVSQAYQITLARLPTAEELAEDVAFVRAQGASYTSADPASQQLAALADFCQVLLCLNEFVYVE
ncbi:MAG: PSD1 and planctomycete cytochrome C domain-containing protein [Pirellulales bacterium]